MAHSLTLKLRLSVFILLQMHVSTSGSSRDHDNAPPASSSSSNNLVRTSCIHASYPDICVRTLSTFPDPPTTPRELAQAAVKVSIAHARKLSTFLAADQEAASRKREKAALNDCLEQMSDSVDELQKTLSELGRLREAAAGGSFKLRMRNAETWVSAALSDDETCLDGLGEAGKVKEEVRKRIVGVAKVTSNALYLINQLDAKKGG
ncbi:unnamed protein product [Rhodiola kirilowii]